MEPDAEWGVARGAPCATNVVPVREIWGEETFNQRQGELRRWAKAQAVDTKKLLAVERALRHHGWHPAESMPDGAAYPTSKGHPVRDAKDAVLEGILSRECFNGWPGDDGVRTTTGEQVYACLMVLRTAGAPSELMTPMTDAYGVALPTDARPVVAGASDDISAESSDVDEGERYESNLLDSDHERPPAIGGRVGALAPAARASSQLGDGSRAQLVPPEACNVVEYRTTPATGAGARRSESVLVKRFEQWLVAEGHDVQRVQIRPIGESAPLVTDTYDVTSGVLYEAKSKADRATIRLGVGQLLDYLRFLPGVKGSLLLPADPSYDLRSFVFSCGLAVTFPQGSSWITNEA